MSPQLQQVFAQIDSPEERLRQQLSSTEQIQVIEYINTRQRSSVLETIANLRPAKAAHSLSQQTSFKTHEKIDAEILEEKAVWTN